MALIINTNISALSAQNNLSTSQTALQTSLQRLSSGLRINSAKDDAAGLAISARMTSQINGLDQAVRNANDGVSLAQTAEGSLSTAADMLQRIRQLAVQSGNATNNATDRQALQAETAALTAELDRLANAAQFNGKNLLDGSFGSANFQVGANANQTITANTADFRTSQYGGYRMGSVVATTANSYGDLTVGTTGVGMTQEEAGAAAVTSGASRITSSGAFIVNGSAGSATITYGVGASAATVAAAIAAKSNLTNVTADAETRTDITGMTAGTSYSIGILSNNSSAVTLAFTVGGTSGTPTATNLASAIKAFNDVSAQTGVTASIDNAGTGFYLLNSSGNDIALTNGNVIVSGSTANNFTITNPAGSGVVISGGYGSVVTGDVTIDSSKSFGITLSGAVSGFNGFFTGTSLAAQLQSVSQIDVSNVDAANRTISIVDNALAAINGQRADFGALQSRFQATINNLQSSSLNISAARSRILDTNFAAETANYTQNQILQQAGTAMLAQANTLPQLALTLLAKLP